jgi:3-methylfumaryl-CoA hydratase
VSERTELIQRGPAEALAALLGVPMPEDELPLFWHWVYLLDRPASSALGRDGHVASGVEAGRRRMFAGGRVRSVAPLRFDEPATRHATVLATEDKQGRSGRLTFVTVGHQVFQRDALVVDEQQTLVYRDLPAAATVAEPLGEPQPVGDHEWSIEVTPPLLFRFSALTYNGHRIHYDRDYARDVEGYPGLVTHGPLQALAMAELAREHGAPRSLCEYRLVAPLFEHQGLVVHGGGTPFEAGVRDLSGRQTARATIT